MSRLNSVRLISSTAIFLLIFTGCGKPAPDGEADSNVEINPLAQYAGDWMTESYVGDAEEPAVVALLKATDSKDNWALKFTHIDEPVSANSVVVVGDSVVSTWGPFPSGFREGLVVEGMTTYMKMYGDEGSGRGVANYSDGSVVNNLRLKSERVK